MAFVSDPVPFPSQPIFDIASPVSTPASSSSLVPTIDISPYLQNPTSQAADDVCQAIRAACLHTGFFQIIGHGVPASTLTEAFEASRRFYALPLEQKQKLDITKQIGFRGYDGIGTQSYGPDTLPDLKESFFIGRDVLPSDPKYGRILTGSNVWPEFDVLPAVSFKEPLEAYFGALMNLTFKILEILSQTLPYGGGIFDQFVRDPAAPMRLLHYPPTVGPTDAAAEERQLGASAHTDFGAITLLLQDRIAGLQVRDPDTGDWVDVPPREDSFVVNIGDMITRWTAGEYKSSVHRVVNRSGADRYSIAFFFDGNIDCPLDPLDGTTPIGGSVTVEQHMIECLRSSYAKK
ncbi:Clavaminate synthase-like protein [Penicillium frequentans]|uniref:Clavaminate synthase-like protein n=1 Tax=Penicillium frequentans TaxID=3151616 RepID=A0AAD6D1A1_9EURO|nr:Clavaminate synthase-like protein [Penicillium glabrum]